MALQGSCDLRFARVREELERNFAERGEGGAAVCVMVGGRSVADLWGGRADAARNLPWQADTLVMTLFFAGGESFARRLPAAEIPAANGMATARALAGMYAPLAAGGGGLVDAGTLRRMSTVESQGDDLVLLLPTRFAQGS